MKIRANKTIITIATVFSAAALLSACDEDFAEITNPGRQTAESLEALSECNAKNEGEIAIVKETGALYLCADSAWKKMVASEKVDVQNGTDGKDGKNGTYCTVSALKDSSGYDILCDGKKVGTILNGKNGAKGEKGDNGALGDKGADGDAGSDCSAKALTDGSGFELSCGGKVVGTIKNGTNGSKGENGADCSGKVLENGAGIELTCGGKVVGTFQNGEDGAKAKNCETLDLAEGVIAINCGNGSPIIRYKALCGTTPYDPENKVCLYVDQHKGKIIGPLAPLCNGKAYNPYDVEEQMIFTSDDASFVISSLKATSKQKCKDGVIVNVCGDEEINLEKKFCYHKKIYDKCNGEKYNPETQICSEGKVLTKCGNDAYDPEKQVCKDDKVLSKCGDETFDPEREYCDNNQVATLLTCSSLRNERYNPKKYMCDDRDSSRLYKITTITIPEKNYSETWMAQNLNYAARKGNSYCAGSTAAEQIASCAKYGRLYSWAAAVGKPEEECGYNQSCDLGDGNVQGVCPEGWHLPSMEEFETLIEAVGGEDKAGKALKSKDGWQSNSGITNDDTYSFAALPAGYYNEDGFDKEGYDARFWSSSQYYEYYAYILYLDYNGDKAYLYYRNKYYGYSVRCIKNKTAPTP